jgi:hypothetical protein
VVWVVFVVVFDVVFVMGVVWVVYVVGWWVAWVERAVFGVRVANVALHVGVCVAMVVHVVVGV